MLALMSILFRRTTNDFDSNPRHFDRIAPVYDQLND